jgi:hypothetical protein
MNLSRFARKTVYGALQAHRAHQRWRRKISVRQSADLEESIVRLPLKEQLNTSVLATEAAVLQLE